MAKNNFLPIPDAPGYEINSKGEVRNIRTGKILKPCGHKNRPTPKFHIPKYNIIRTAKSLRRQALAAHREKDRQTSWLPIPSADGKLSRTSRKRQTNFVVADTVRRRKIRD